MTFAVGNNPAVSKRDAFRPQRGSFVDSIFSFVTWPPRETAQVEVKVRTACFLFLHYFYLPAGLPSCLSVRPSKNPPAAALLPFLVNKDSQLLLQPPSCCRELANQ